MDREGVCYQNWRQSYIPKDRVFWYAPGEEAWESSESPFSESFVIFEQSEDILWQYFLTGRGVKLKE